jgi:RimJ/RimL family protein N-acetyltransferase
MDSVHPLSIHSLKEAKANDLNRLAAFVNSAYRGESSKSGWTTEADLLDGQRTDPDSLRAMLGPSQVILLAEDPDKGDSLLGCVYLKKAEDSAYLGMLTVHPEMQDRGLGRQILAAAENFVQRKWQARSLHMTVITLRDELIAWYERRGYIKTNQKEKFPYGEARFGLPKRPDLEFVVLKKDLPVLKFDFQPHLTSDHVQIRPLKKEDFEALYEVASDPLIWEQHSQSDRYQREIFKTYFDQAIESGGGVLILDANSGAVAGASRFYEWSPEKSEVVIGYTFLGRKYWGGPFNQEVKRLMLTHAFRFVEKAHFHVSESNFRSQKAIQKLGAEFIGNGQLNGQPRLIFQVERTKYLNRN